MLPWTLQSWSLQIKSQLLVILHALIIFSSYHLLLNSIHTSHLVILSLERFSSLILGEFQYKKLKMELMSSWNYLNIWQSKLKMSHNICSKIQSKICENKILEVSIYSDWKQHYSPKMAESTCQNNIWKYIYKLELSVKMLVKKQKNKMKKTKEIIFSS